MTRVLIHKRFQAKPVQGFNTKAFLQTVSEGLGQAYMGYAFILQDGNGERLVEAEYGLARVASEDDGEQSFTIRTKTAWGSVSKMVTFTAAMHRIQVVQSQPLGITTVPATPKPSLLAPMKAFLPRRWQQILHPGFADVTIGMLMQHRAGFAKTQPAPIWERLKNGPETDEGVGTRHYSNTSASMFQSMPFFFDPTFAQQGEEQLENRPTDDYNSLIDIHGKNIYQKYVQENIWQPLGITARCNDADFPRKNYAMFYASPSDTNGKKVEPDPEDPKCAPGGWVLSPLAMGQFVHALTATNKIISAANYALMGNTASTSQRLGWASVYTFPNGTGFSHNGARWNGMAKAEMIVFPNGFTAVAASNSKPPENSTSFNSLFRQAYEAALTTP